MARFVLVNLNSRSRSLLDPVFLLSSVHLFFKYSLYFGYSPSRHLSLKFSPHCSSSDSTFHLLLIR
jgi:hypothetical protein